MTSTSFTMPKLLLAGVLGSLYAEDQLMARLVCREWNSIIEPLLVCHDAHAYDGSGWIKKMGKFTVSKRIVWNVLNELNLIKSYCPKIKCLWVYLDDDINHLVIKFLHYFAQSGVSIGLRGIPYLMLADIKVFSLDLRNLEKPVEFLPNVNQPQLKELTLRFPSIEVERGLALLPQKFKELEKLDLTLENFSGNLSNLFIDIHSLKVLELSILQFDGQLTPPTIVTNIRHLVLGKKTFNRIHHQLCIKGVEKLDLRVYEEIPHDLDSVFPDLECLTLAQSKECNEDFPAETLVIRGPANVVNLNLFIESQRFQFVPLDIWPNVRKVTIKLEWSKVMGTTMDWALTCFPSIESITLKLPKTLSSIKNQFNNLKHHTAKSLKKFYSNENFQFEAISTLMMIAPNLSLIACPMDETTKLALEGKFPMVIEDLPDTYFDNE